MLTVENMNIDWNSAFQSLNRILVTNMIFTLAAWNTVTNLDVFDAVCKLYIFKQKLTLILKRIKLYLVVILGITIIGHKNYSRIFSKILQLIV